MSDFNIEKLKDNFANLDEDIVAIDTKLSDLEMVLLDLKNNINRAKTSLNNKQVQPADKKSLYAIMNNSLELMSTFYQTHQRFLDLKFKYRKEQDDLTYKAAHMAQIELAKIDKAVDTSYYGVIELLKTLTNTDNGKSKQADIPDEIKAELKGIEDDDLYSMK